MLQCEQCGSQEIELTDGKGATEPGQTFEDSYQCQDCDATGTLTGTIDSESTYEYNGPLFNSVDTRITDYV